MQKKHGKEVANKPLLYENFTRKDYFEEEVKEYIHYFERKYSNCEIVVKRNKHGARIIAYQKQTP